MKILILTLLTLNLAYAQTSCRDAVVGGYTALEQPIEADSFSLGEFSDFNITPEQYNALSPEEQEDIYQYIKPMEVMVEQTISMINRNINQVVGTFYEFFMVDELQNWRAARDVLRACKLD